MRDDFVLVSAVNASKELGIDLANFVQLCLSKRLPLLSDKNDFQKFLSLTPESLIPFTTRSPNIKPIYELDTELLARYFWVGDTRDIRPTGIYKLVLKEDLEEVYFESDLFTILDLTDVFIYAFHLEQLKDAQSTIQNGMPIGFRVYEVPKASKDKFVFECLSINCKVMINKEIADIIEFIERQFEKNKTKSIFVSEIRNHFSELDSSLANRGGFKKAFQRLQGGKDVWDAIIRYDDTDKKQPRLSLKMTRLK